MSLTYSAAVEQTITAGEQIHQIVNGTATTEVTVEDGSKVPSIRKALLDNFYFKDPIAWQVGQTENVFNQLRKFTDGSWWYAPSATASNPITMGSTPVGDSLWKAYSFDAIGKLTPQLREALRRSYAEAGYNLVDGSFEAGGTLVNANDVLLQERTGKAFSGPAGTVAAGTNPASGGFVDKSGVATSASAISNANGGSVQGYMDSSRPYSSFSSMINNTANYTLSLGLRVSTGISKWSINDSGRGVEIIGTGFFATPLNGVWLSDFEAPMTDPESGLGEYCDSHFAEAQAVAELVSGTVKIPAGIFKFQSEAIFKANTSGVSKESSILLFDNNVAATNLNADNSVNHSVRNIHNIGFYSNKESRWNSDDAGDSFVHGISSFKIRNKYGQRVAKGNITTTPNNILSNDPSQQQIGGGFWNKNYNQWMGLDGSPPDISGLPSRVRRSDECLFSMSPRSSITDCSFVGFEKGLVLFGTYQHRVSGCVFESCYRGLCTVSDSYIGGTGNSRVTSTKVTDNDFVDCLVGADLYDFGQSEISNNVFQPCNVSIMYSFGAGSTIRDNYSEIVHSGVYIVANDDSSGTEIDNNYVNASYSRYNTYMESGKRYKLNRAGASNKKVKVNAGVSLTYIGEDWVLNIDPGFFTLNGNKWNPYQVKEYYIRTKGLGGTSFSITVASPENGVKLDIVPSQAGLSINNNLIASARSDTRYVSKIISMDIMDIIGDFRTWYLPLDDADPRNIKAAFFRQSTGDVIDLRANGVEHLIKIVYQ